MHLKHETLQTSEITQEISWRFWFNLFKNLYINSADEIFYNLIFGKTQLIYINISYNFERSITKTDDFNDMIVSVCHVQQLSCWIKTQTTRLAQREIKWRTSVLFSLIWSVVRYTSFLRNIHNFNLKWAKVELIVEDYSFAI